MALFTNIIEGLQILKKYVPDTEHIGGAEHDVIYAIPAEIIVTDKDHNRLRELGWSHNAEFGWYHYV
jgi:hypothetical protein